MRNTTGDARTEQDGTQLNVSAGAATTDQLGAVEQGRRTTAYIRIQVADICFANNLSDSEMDAVLAALQTQNAALLALEKARRTR
ncbi:hypothetical protein ACRB8A_14935 [Arthrobacter sp. G.S.26]|uniref:hypothetical protein n=1 Tax=Arthrobacter sp. G.S.26 TaxID=3433706 RepID=UPI003D772F9A